MAIPDAEQAIIDKLQERSRKLLCLDFDGVLHSYTSGWKGALVIPDPPVAGAIAFLSAAVRRFRVAIYSSRSGEPLGIDAMQLWLRGWCAHSGMEAAEINWLMRFIEWPRSKPPAFLTIDDRAVQFTGIWPELDDIDNFKPWTAPRAVGGV